MLDPTVFENMRALYRVFVAATAWRQDAAVQAELVRQGLQVYRVLKWSDTHETVSLVDSLDNRVYVNFQPCKSKVFRFFRAGSNESAVCISFGKVGEVFSTSRLLTPSEGTIADTIGYLRDALDILETITAVNAAHPAL